MDDLIEAVRQFQIAQSEWERHSRMYYARWQMDEPLTSGERRADEQLERVERGLRDNLVNAREKMIALAIKQFGWESEGKKP